MVIYVANILIIISKKKKKRAQHASESITIIIMDTTIMNNNDNTNPGNVIILLKGNNAGEMAMMGVHTILCASINTYTNSRTYAQAIQGTQAQAQAAHHKRGREQGRTTITPALFSNTMGFSKIS